MPRFRRLISLTTAAAVALALSAAAGAATSKPYVVQAQAFTAATLPPALNPPVCVTPSGVALTCYSPALIKQAYAIPTGFGAPTGAGQTIVLVDAFGSATIQSDLATFDDTFALPAPASFTILGPNGSGDQTDGGVRTWKLETALDVEYAHAIAPGANIVLAVAASDDNKDIIRAEANAIARYPGAIVSQSFGTDESTARADLADELTLHALYALAQGLGDTVLASTGDGGATQYDDHVTAEFPASDPLVTAVGGTMGNPYPDGLWSNGGYGGEQAWNEPARDMAGGGAPSILFPAPSWQRELSRNRMRTVPDVSYDAAFDGGVLLYNGGHVTLLGGVSAGAPQWAGIFALANELRARSGQKKLGFVNDTLYELAKNPRTYAADFHDITVGDNTLAESDLGFPATPGYDLATGLGTPNVANLIGDLARRGGGRGDR